MFTSGTDDHEIAAPLPTGIRYWLALALGFSLLFFTIYTGATFPFHPTVQRGVFLLIVVVLTVVMRPMRGWFGFVWDALVLIGGITSIGYLLLNWEVMAYRASFDPQLIEYILGCTVVVVVLDTTRRVMGWSLSICAVVCLAYAYFGNWLPEPFTHRGYSLARLLANQYLTHEGLFSSLLGIAVDVIAIFVLFGCLMQHVGLGELLMRVATRFSGNSHGGPAKVAVLSSALFGTVSGSSTSNVVATGTTTIPLMKRYGFSNNFAGAVEAAASTGGQLMPPIMGVAAFLMAEVTGIPYASIALAATLPAILYYAALFIEVHLEAQRLGLRGAKDRGEKFTREQILNLRLMIPLGVLIYFMMEGYSPARAALISLTLLLGLALPMGKRLIQPGKLLELMWMFINAIVVVGLACAVSGVLIGALNITGATMRLSYVIVELAGDSKILLLFGTAILIIILGTGLPTPAAYAVGAAFAAPTLVLAGFGKLGVHMFVLFYACLSSVSPPVAISAFAAAAIARGSPTATGFIASKLVIGAFLIPFMFVWDSSFFLGFADTGSLIRAAVTGLVGVGLLSVTTIGHFGRPMSYVERGLYAIAAFCFLEPSILTDGIGSVLTALLLAFNMFMIRRARAKPAVAG